MNKRIIDIGVKLLSIIGVSVLLRWFVTYHSYSGEKKYPIYGDYEAQRHWQEITYNLPIDNWYKNSTDNDLQYWGLDYPPLTAYHSYIIGYISYLINPNYIKLNESRGYESTSHKYFMRLTVLISDLLIYIPSIIIYFYFSKIIDFKNTKKYDKKLLFQLNNGDLLLIISLIYPGLILIDYGHFQYNSISLGLFIFAIAFIIHDLISISSIFFVLALNYKQMELYHSLPFFFYILSKSISSKKSLLLKIKNLLKIALIVLLTFGIIWAPFLKNWSSFSHVIHRLFPINRGLFEDKVANLWCSLNIFIKLNKLFNNYHLAKISLITTIISIIPSNLDLYLKPYKDKFLLSVINTSLGFYLFSFQVHEKSILLVAIPIILYYPKIPLASFWFLIISNFSMLPLFIKDGLFIPYCSLMIFYIISCQWISFNNISKYCSKNMIRNNKNSKNNYENNDFSNDISTNSIKNILLSIIFNRYFSIILFIISMTGVILLSIASVLLKPPDRYPDLFPLFVSLFSFVHFFLFFLYFNTIQLYSTDRKLFKFKLN